MEPHQLLINAICEQVLGFSIITLEPSDFTDTITLVREPDITIPKQLENMDIFIRATVPSGNFIDILKNYIMLSDDTLNRYNSFEDFMKNNESAGIVFDSILTYFSLRRYTILYNGTTYNTPVVISAAFDNHGLVLFINKFYAMQKQNAAMK